MKKTFAVSMLTAGLMLASIAQANTLSSTAIGQFTQSFAFTTTAAAGNTNTSDWFRFAVTASATDFGPFTYTISGGDLAGSFSGMINAVGSNFKTGFLDKSDGVQNFSSGHTYTLTVGGTTLATGTKAFGLTSNVGATITAVPEPESYAMLLAGLGVMATVARRRAARA